MTGVLLLAHGSREPEAGQDMEAVAAMVRTLLPDCLLAVAFLQFGGQTLEDGLLHLAGQGAREIRVLPYFLFEGVHIRRLEATLVSFQEMHPEVSIRLGRVLGADERLAQILADRARELE